MSDASDGVREVENPAELLRNENGVFEVTSPYGYVFEVTCHPGTKMSIRGISEPKSAIIKEERMWRIKRVHRSVA